MSKDRLLDTSDSCDSEIVTMTRVRNYCHYLLHHLHVQYLSIMFDIFIIALALWMHCTIMHFHAKTTPVF